MPAPATSFYREEVVHLVSNVQWFCLEHECSPMALHAQLAGCEAEEQICDSQVGEMGRHAARCYMLSRGTVTMVGTWILLRCVSKGQKGDMGTRGGGYLC